MSVYFPKNSKFALGKTILKQSRKTPLAGSSTHVEPNQVSIKLGLSLRCRMRMESIAGAPNSSIISSMIPRHKQVKKLSRYIRSTSILVAVPITRRMYRESHVFPLACQTYIMSSFLMFVHNLLA